MWENDVDAATNLRTRVIETVRAHVISDVPVVAEHTAAVRGLHEELERGLSLLRAVRRESDRLSGNRRPIDETATR